MPNSHDRAVCAAAAACAETLVLSGKPWPEARLVSAFRSALNDGGDLLCRPGEEGFGLPQWTRDPGGVDLVADEPGTAGSGVVLMEMKVGKPDEGIWDAIKLADALARHGEPATWSAYLVYAAPRSVWEAARIQGLLFAPGRATHTPLALISTWPKAWLKLLVGGRGIRPKQSVGGVAAELLCSDDLAADVEYELRVVRVSPGSGPAARYDEDGWPVDYEPPEGMRETGQLADEALANPATITNAEPDPCHGYPWFGKWSQQRLDAVVPALDDDSFQCLRRRLGTERNWTEDELRTRVDPLRDRGATVSESAKTRACEALQRRLREILPRERAELIDDSGRTETFEDNLVEGFEPWQISELRAHLKRGDGGELKYGPGGERPDAHAVHSSAMLAFNAFGRWLGSEDQLAIDGVTGFGERLTVEKKLRIFRGGRAPNLDVVVAGPERVAAIESKLTETLAPHSPREWSSAYARESCRALLSAGWLALLDEHLAGHETRSYLDTGQLIKHALGLAKQYPNREQHLVYVYWEPLGGDDEEAVLSHRAEVSAFAQRLQGASPVLHALTYDELWREWETLSEPGWVEHHVAALRRRYDVPLDDR